MGLFDTSVEKNVRDLLATTSKEYHVVMDKLKRVVASGNFHHELLPKHLLMDNASQNILQIIDGIPICCKIDLRGSEAPLTITISYVNQRAKDES